ncbi:hypothetical protein BMS_3130 [Halobacteriovorax marinus SJ]|uniref:Peptidase S74 domain-containing protein n=1 Tax=Halobacteriovorax marinus (strain ATCC BAA-682 / DSM 15412 / SJ) TaxID=862908 RepID=E1WZV1_HALMS|nr:tail fiber domain-containing protein [Halobacteriovorax marinus]CBW27887.1 hypothetical protein BMS_3130 [Halobacteriovorax marinus SJ]
MSTDNDKKKEYDFGELKEFNLQEIEEEVLNESIYIDVFAGSDVRFKENINPLSDAMKGIASLNAYTYNYKTEEFPENKFSQREQIGVMAQELESVFPQAVAEDEKGMKYVNYSMLTPILLEAVKELNKKVEDQQAQIEVLLKKVK